MSLQVALGITNVVLGLGNIGAGVGFGVAENNKMDELNAKADKLKDDANEAGDLYDQVYYLVAVNLDRFQKALDKQPAAILETLEDQILADLKESDTETIIETVAKVLGYTGGAVGVLTSLAQVALYFRNRKASKTAKTEEPAEPVEEPFDNVPLDGETPAVVPETESSLPQSTNLTRLMTGLNVAGVVFGIAGLGTTIGLGCWTLDKLEKAISDVEKKQKQVTEFKESLTNVLNEIVEAAGDAVKDYDDLTAMAEVWKKIAENFDSYEKALYYAIQGYYMNKSLEDIKSLVGKVSDEGKTLPEDGYPLAKQLADDIKYQFDQGKSDQEVVAFFATDNPDVGLRFVFDEFFICNLRFL